MYRWCVDAEKRYVCKGNPLIKKPEDPVAAAAHKEANRVRSLVLDLLEPYLGTSRNVTGDRYFSSYELTKELLTEHQTTYLGTLMSNKRKIPPTLHEKLQLHESKFVFGGPSRKISLCVYQAKQKKKIYMISSLHHDRSIIIADDTHYSKSRILHQTTIPEKQEWTWWIKCAEDTPLVSRQDGRCDIFKICWILAF